MRLQIEGQRIWLADTFVDFRKAINRLLAIIAEQNEAKLKQDIFVFYNRRRDKLKIIGWHRNGYVLIYKCLDRGQFKVEANANAQLFSLSPKATELAVSRVGLVINVVLCGG